MKNQFGKTYHILDPCRRSPFLILHSQRRNYQYDVSTNGCTILSYLVGRPFVRFPERGCGYSQSRSNPAMPRRDWVALADGICIKKQAIRNTSPPNQPSALQSQRPTRSLPFLHALQSILSFHKLQRNGSIGITFVRCD